jgi:hypothetical protein
LAYKDAFLALGALLSPFAAFLVGWLASSRQANAALKVARLQAEQALAIGKAQIDAQTTNAQRQIQAAVENTKAQVRATVEIAYQQSVLDKFRDHVGETLAVLHDAADARQRTERNEEFALKMKALKSKLASLTLSPPSGRAPVEFFDQVIALLNVINAQPAGQKWSDNLISEFADRYKQLAGAAVTLIADERKSIALDA